VPRSLVVNGTNHHVMNMQDPNRFEKAAEAKLRVIKHLPKDGDLSLIILKGHLLIEELLFALVSSAARDPSAIASARLGYYELASVAKALFYEKRMGPVWGAMFELNKLRNTFAHNLEPPDLKEKLQRFAAVGSGGHAKAAALLASDPVGVMVNSIEVMCGVLIGLLSSRSSKGSA
jgi:hypothetical protein